VTVLAAQIDGADVNALRTILDQMKDKLKSAVVLLAASDGEKSDIDCRCHARPYNPIQGWRYHP
jgi:alanyl-tRNA synthetase